MFLFFCSDLEDYYFYHWQHIGAFIYFSHHSITIPPPCWTNAAHRHGVLSMGTLITEWEDGAKMCFRSEIGHFSNQDINFVLMGIVRCVFGILQFPSE